MQKKEKTIAYLIQAHHQPEHFSDLVFQLNHEQVCFFVHIDKKSDQELFLRKVKTLKNIYFVQKRVDVKWGGYSQVQATLSMMELALKSDYDFQYFVLLSGACYPIKSNNHIIKFFQNNNQNYIDIRNCGYYKKNKYLYSNFLYYLSEKAKKYKIFSLITTCIAPRKKWQEYSSYYVRMYMCIGKSHFREIFKSHILNIFANFILPAKKNPKNITKFYCGSQWWYLRQETIKFLFQFLTDKKNKSIIKFYKYSSCSDERIFQTVLKNTEDKKDHRLSVTKPKYVVKCEISHVWPKILDEQDFLPIQKSEKLFARKFDFEKSAVLKQKLKKIIT